MIGLDQFLLFFSVGIGAISAGILGAAPRQEAPHAARPARVLRAGVLRGWAWLRGLPRRWRTSGGGDLKDLRGSAGSLLHQYAALLQSGRSQAQAWADLSAHWRSREDSHPLAQICERASSAEHCGLGAVVGLRRSLDSFTEGHRPGAGPGPRVTPVRVSANATVVLTEVLQRLITIHALSQSTGAPLSRLCRKAAESLEDSAALDAAVRTAAAGPRLTQLILAALPLGGLAMGALMGAQPLVVLFGSSLGWGCLTAGLGCMFLGWRWSTRLIRSVTPYG